MQTTVYHYQSQSSKISNGRATSGLKFVRLGHVEGVCSVPVLVVLVQVLAFQNALLVC